MNLLHRKALMPPPYSKYSGDYCLFEGGAYFGLKRVVVRSPISSILSHILSHVRHCDVTFRTQCFLVAIILFLFIRYIKFMCDIKTQCKLKNVIYSRGLISNLKADNFKRRYKLRDFSIKQIFCNLRFGTLSY